MKVPSLSDRRVKVRAFFTDEGFGYDYWQAKQFMTPADARPAVLIICEDEDEQRRLLAEGGRKDG